MSELEKSGYKGIALRLLQDAGCKIGDIVCVISRGRTYEGILIPRAERGDAATIVIKMKSGYNVGITAASKEVTVEKMGAGVKPAFASPTPPKQNTELPHVVIMSTGGTIASRVDYRTSAVHSVISATELYSTVPELADIAYVDTEMVFNLYSENLTPKHWTELAHRIADCIKQGDVDGIVVTQGTDTMGYTAAALSFALQNLPIPIVFVGAQRSSDRPSSDAATNLIGAVKVAAEAPFAEVGLAMHETVSDTVIVVHRGVKVRKCHTSRRDTFKSINGFPIAKVVDQKIHMQNETVFQCRDLSKQLVLKSEFCEKVALVKFYPGMDPAVIDFYVNQEFKGILLEGSGLGHVSTVCFEAIKNAISKGVIVALASQCIWGRVNMNIYDTGRDLQSFGVISLEDMFAETGLVKLMWVLGQTSDIEEAKRLLKTNIAGEFTLRTFPQEKNVYGAP
ncbi:MAG: Glu-tRNA(Gln) amidotransferase subunit GatD [Candidatus Bathyarchaeota archaeon]|uniref:Glu-tRNA(Gln) amidotransferase subunit GatD n=1 Tax=Candidatus Bathycorpusculum sp. TaxID=2994959 RepID=UPI002816A562|nr:Glu-tRNA(Gln) amidotransferase subunit GatD [Candidatus Termiticorpusculum sp.]MCL2257061.1 Glu-tRNA(Gln) amidotransferase subunit GatD [Candidatus Termiticorpusculum sp.]MCL2292813.1 Glu-tRNA(Gln) amidotransferase subunit GatD [Candidatus Termiticorpusculum sp.]